MQPLLPQQHFGQWIRHLPHLALIIFCGVLIIGCASTTTNAPPPTPTPAATATATATPKPSQSSGTLTPTHGTPRVGGPISDFVGAYGQPNSNGTPGSVYHFLSGTNGSADGLIASTFIGGNRVDDLIVAPTGGAQWTPDDAKNRCMTFAPSDAHFKQRFEYADNTGFDLVYSSTQLSHDLPAAEFLDKQQNQVRAGLFDVSYLYTSDGHHIDSCDLIPGEQQITD